MKLRQLLAYDFAARLCTPEIDRSALLPLFSDEFADTEMQYRQRTVLDKK